MSAPDVTLKCDINFMSWSHSKLVFVVPLLKMWSNLWRPQMALVISQYDGISAKTILLRRTSYPPSPKLVQTHYYELATWHHRQCHTLCHRYYLGCFVNLSTIIYRMLGFLFLNFGTSYILFLWNTHRRILRNWSLFVIDIAMSELDNFAFLKSFSHYHTD